MQNTTVAIGCVPGDYGDVCLVIMQSQLTNSTVQGTYYLSKITKIKNKQFGKNFKSTHPHEIQLPTELHKGIYPYLVNPTQF